VTLNLLKTFFNVMRKCSSVIKAAINGSRAKSDHPCVPITPEEQMREARAAIAAGAGAIHVHVRDAAGRESLAPNDVARCLNAIRDGNPGTSVGISTGAWIVPNAKERLALVEMWGTLPDFASVNVHEQGSIELMRTLLNKGVGVEAGVWNANAARLLIKSGQVENCLRILIEPAENSLDPGASLRQIETALERVTVPRLLHGTDEFAWEAILLAAQRGYDTRAGLEDTLRLPDGSIARDNAGLIAAALRIHHGGRRSRGA
jgi:uncharacterized protein (DUF849 family)